MLKQMIEGIVTKVTETHYVTMEGNVRHVYHKKWYRIHQETESTGKVIEKREQPSSILTSNGEVLKQRLG